MKVPISVLQPEWRGATLRASFHTTLHEDVAVPVDDQPCNENTETKEIRTDHFYHDVIFLFVLNSKF